MKLEVLYEDNHLIAVNKPAGLVVQDNEHGLASLEHHVKSYIKIKYNKPGAVFLGCIHRLDTNVTGIVLFARTSKALTRMNDQFKNRLIQKTYAALIRRKPQPMAGTLEHWLKKDPKQNKTKLYHEQQDGSKKAILHYEFINTANHCFLLKVRPITGRPHQIRVQLARTFTGIVGDVKYGQTKPTSDKSIYLHALGLSFVHPVSKENLNLHAPMPEFGNWKFFKDIEKNLLEK
ncbi:MAG: RluA family pseudouridine synthase [Bacteroidia bacterium]|jgi:23S rRNA pseudouridine1911/1915/1917 synthase|nr:RluA family pseudouridine synthase [Bacteroidia bacterium]